MNNNSSNNANEMFFEVPFDVFIKFLAENKLHGKEYDASLGLCNEWYDNEDNLLATAVHGFTSNIYKVRGECNHETISFISSILT